MLEREKQSEIEDRIGCQGWNYSDWVTKPGEQSVFYPRGTKAVAMLEAYSQMFDTVEVDSSFYAIPPSSTLENWYQKTPENFTFSLKMPQSITHERVMHSDSFEILEEFCERILILREKLGIVLIQTAPSLEASKTNAQNLRKFLAKLPKNVRFSIEFRNRDWLVEWTLQELRKNNVSLCLVEGDWIPRDLMFQTIANPTADFSYVRFMGDRNLEQFNKVVRPNFPNLQTWKDELERLTTTKNYIYFSNFYEGHAPSSANSLKELFGQEVVNPIGLETQKSLF